MPPPAPGTEALASTPQASWSSNPLPPARLAQLAATCGGLTSQTEATTASLAGIQPSPPVADQEALPVGTRRSLCKRPSLHLLAGSSFSPLLQETTEESIDDKGEGARETAFLGSKSSAPLPGPLSCSRSFRSAPQSSVLKQEPGP